MKGFQMKRKKRKTQAFTLVELLVVILIISMLAAFVAPRMFKGLGRAKVDIARAKMAIIEGALGQFYIDCGRYPDDSEGLEVLLVPAADIEEKWNGPYLKRSDLLDPWNNPYIYLAEGEYNVGSFDLISLGADGMEGGEGENADIVND
ncbi:MAG: type II secretion system major pseudopilin GspG [Sedimentisphaerales bacterium]|nr:type II secretion system major pseudopilin GspG [Sedimentisphaerales bacterium]